MYTILDGDRSIGMCEHDGTFSFDLMVAYLHVPFYPDHSGTCRGQQHQQSFHFRALPFSLNTVPLVFMRIVESIASSLTVMMLVETENTGLLEIVCLIPF